MRKLQNIKRTIQNNKIEIAIGIVFAGAFIVGYQTGGPARVVTDVSATMDGNLLISYNKGPSKTIFGILLAD